MINRVSSHPFAGGVATKHGRATPKASRRPFRLLAAVAAAVLSTLMAPAPSSAGGSSSSGSSASSAQWPEFRYGPARTAFNPSETTIGTANVGTLVLGWNRRMPPTLQYLLASPVITGSTMYLVERSLVAVSPTSGKVKWSVAGPGYTESTPAIDGKSVFVSWSNGDVVAYDAITHTARWTTNLRSANFTSGPGTPGVRNGIVYVVAIPAENRSVLYALDEITGTIRWSVNFSDYAGTPAITAHVLVLGFRSGLVKAFDPLSGARLWSTSTPAWSGNLGVQGNVVYIAEACDAVALNASTGALIFSTVLIGCNGSSAYGPALAYGRVYVNNSGHLYAIDGVTGAVDWTAISAGGDPTVANGVVYQAFQNLRAFDATSGAVLFDTPIAGVAINGVQVAGGHVFVARELNRIRISMYMVP